LTKLARICEVTSKFLRASKWALLRAGRVSGPYTDREPLDTGRHVKLWGRREHCAALDELLADTRNGDSRVLVIRGEPGIGKTALLKYAVDAAADFRVVRAEGVESEMELPFAALHQLCGGMTDRFERLPGPQRAALAIAFGLQPGEPPDRFLVGLALFGLLSDVAAEQPLLCVVDDAQWLDQSSAHALAFVARRVTAESIAILIGTRDIGTLNELDRLAEMYPAALSDEDARALLASVMAGRLDERVRDRIIAESGGNPLALLEFPHSATSIDLAGGFGVAGPPPLASRIEQSFLRRITPLPETTRRLLLLAAAEPVGDPALVWRAAERLCIDTSAAEAAESQGLLTIGPTVTFRHPLVRSAIYRSSSVPDRRAAHRALAEATDRHHDPDRRAWHLAQGASGPNEDVAVELERSAARAQARGGLAAAAAFLERATALTPDPARRVERALSAASATLLAGACEAAQRLLAVAEAGPLTARLYAQVDLLRGRIAFVSKRGREAPALLLKAAQGLQPFDPGLARETYVQAMSAATFAGHLATGGSMREVALAALTAPAPAQPDRVPDLLMDGLALLVTKGRSASAPLLKQALATFCTDDTATEDDLRWLSLAISAAQLRWDIEGWDRVSARYVDVSRDAGALSTLPMALAQRAVLHLFRGDFTAAAAVIQDACQAAKGARSKFPCSAKLALTALRGLESQCVTLVASTTEDLARRGEGSGLIFAHWATAVLYNGLGRYRDALTAAQRTGEDPDEPVFSLWASAELVEAATRCDEPELANAAAEQLTDGARSSGTAWALGIDACTRALTTKGKLAETLYRESLDYLRHTGLQLPIARTKLVYGEWLRRQNRRADAREQLRAADELFTAMGAEGFAERAGRELRAAGERSPKRTISASAGLTSRETQIARLAGDGLSNPDIAAQLYMSRRTVEYHLGKIFAKLAISSRNQINAVLAENDTGEPA
jgi:DNA-binding CsgD family transcriptional regulator